MNSLSHIDLLSLQEGLKYSKDEKGVAIVFDPVRRRNVRATPEEIVRQLWILYFIDVLSLNKKLIAVERSFLIHGVQRRFDLVVFDKSTSPVLLVEFKAPDIPINQMTFDQVGHYNMQLKVPYALVSNGRHHYCFTIDDEKREFVFLGDLSFLHLNPLKGS